MKAEVMCRSVVCPSVFIDAYGHGHHYQHVMLTPAPVTVCPACGSAQHVVLLREVTDDHRFALGNIVGTAGTTALFAGREAARSAILKRHVRCDWGEVPAADARINDLALGDDRHPAERRRLFSAYDVDDTRIWVITEAGHHATTVLLPEEY